MAIQSQCTITILPGNLTHTCSGLHLIDEIIGVVEQPDGQIIQRRKLWTPEGNAVEPRFVVVQRCLVSDFCGQALHLLARESHAQVKSNTPRLRKIDLRACGDNTARETRLHLHAIFLPSLSAQHSNTSVQHTAFDIIGAQNRSIAAVSESHAGHRLQPDVLPDAARGRVEDALGLGAPELLAARLRYVFGGVEYTERHA